MAKAKTPTKYIVRPVPATKPGMTRCEVRAITPRQRVTHADMPAVFGRPLPIGSIEVSSGGDPRTGRPRAYVQFLNYRIGDMVAILVGECWDDHDIPRWYWGRVESYSHKGVTIQCMWGDGEQVRSVRPRYARPCVIRFHDDEVVCVLTRQQWEARRQEYQIHRHLGWNGDSDVAEPWHHDSGLIGG